MDKRCGTCYYYRDKICCVNPPTAALAPVRTLQGDGIQIIALRPPVQAHEYCGQWSPQEGLVTA